MDNAVANLKVNICGLEFRNPILPAAGPPSKDGATLEAAAKGGAGGLVTKTISVEPAQAPHPNMAEIRGGFLNAELWSELPKEQWIETEYKLARATGLPVIVGLGYTAEQIRELAPLVRPFADALELSTHYVGNNIAPIIDALRAAKEAVDVPVFMKLSPHANIQEIALALEDAGADALVMINSFGPCLGIDLETGLPLMGSKDGFGWLSGVAIKPLALRCVYDAARAVRIPILGVGGISNGRDAAEMLMAGASAVQVCTEAILRGPTVYERIARELNTFLDDHDYASVDEITGRTVRLMRLRGAPHSDGPPQVNMERCVLCGTCERSCPYGAIHRDNDTKALKIDEELCSHCGLCVSRCKLRGLSMEQ
jgi:dihydroorotate dehydrogenase subfamily 1